MGKVPARCRRLSLTVLDYIRAWKQAHFAELARVRVRVAAGEKAGEHCQDSRPVEAPVGNGEVSVAAGGSRIVTTMAGRAEAARRVAFDPRPGPRSAAAGGG